MWFGKFRFVGLVWLVWFVRFGLVGNVNLAITSYYRNFQTDRKPTTYFSGRVRSGWTTGTVIIELTQSSLAGTRLSLAKFLDIFLNDS